MRCEMGQHNQTAAAHRLALSPLSFPRTATNYVTPGRAPRAEVMEPILPTALSPITDMCLAVRGLARGLLPHRLSLSRGRSTPDTGGAQPHSAPETWTDSSSAQACACLMTGHGTGFHSVPRTPADAHLDLPAPP